MFPQPKSLLFLKKRDSSNLFSQLSKLAKIGLGSSSLAITASLCKAEYLSQEAGPLATVH